MEDLKKLIREVPDFPKPGVLFLDITTMLKDKEGPERLVRDQEVGGSNPLAPTNLFKHLQTIAKDIRVQKWVHRGPYSESGR